MAAPVPVRRDAHPGRVKAFSSQSAEAKSRFFDTRYGGRGHMFLRILLCHPDYRRRGAGSELVQWGLKRAVARGLDATLFSSPMGYSLYRQLGFRECGRFLVRVDGEMEHLEVPAMFFACAGRRGSRAGVAVKT